MKTPALIDLVAPDALRRVLEDFYDRIFDDVMIGFLFAGKSKERLVEMEWEFTTNLLGGNVRYTGRSIQKAHAKSPILGGHFDRRLQILKETLADHAVPTAVQEHWIEHTNALRPQVTADASSECDHTAAAARIGREQE
jgi:hemoglobin